MHAGHLAPGTRIWPLFELLVARGAAGATTEELRRLTGSQAVHSDVAAIRQEAGRLGWLVPRAAPGGTTTDAAGRKRKLYRYRIERAGSVEGAAPAGERLPPGGMPSPAAAPLVWRRAPRPGPAARRVSRFRTSASPAEPFRAATMTLFSGGER